MEKNLYISNFKKVPIAFMIACLLCSFSQVMLVRSKVFWKLCYLYSDPISDDGIRQQAQLRMMPYDHRNKRVFFTGSSQTREDFDTYYLNDLFQKRSVEFFNLGVSGATQPIEMFMMEDSLLEKKPDVIVYMPFVGSFYSKYNFNEMKYYFNPKVLPYMFRYLGIKEMFVNKGDFIDSFVSEFSIFFKYRGSFQRIIKNLYLRTERRREVKRFAYSVSKPPAYFQDQIKKSGETRYKKTLYYDLNKELFKLFADRIISNGITLIIISAPVHPLIKETYNDDIDTEWRSFLLEQSNKIGFIFLEKDMLPSFSEEDFIDFTHLNEKGRNKMSVFIAEYFKRYEENDQL